MLVYVSINLSFISIYPPSIHPSIHPSIGQGLLLEGERLVKGDCEGLSDPCRLANSVTLHQAENILDVPKQPRFCQRRFPKHQARLLRQKLGSQYCSLSFKHDVLWNIRSWNLKCSLALEGVPLNFNKMFQKFKQNVP